MYQDLILNASLLVALTTLYNLLARVRQEGKLWVKILSGLLFGAVAIAGMRAPFHYSPGVIYDGRSIVLSMAGLFGGGIVTLVSVLVAGTYRAFLGGSGVWGGTATILFCGLTGLVFRRIHKNLPGNLKVLDLFVLGFVAHLVMLACQMLILPIPSGLAVISRIWMPILLIFPFATVLMGVLLRTEERNLMAYEEIKTSGALYRDLIETSQDLIWRCDADGCYTYLNPAWEDVFGYTVEEMLGKKFTDFQTHDYADRDKIEFARLLQLNTVKGLETVHIGKDGREIHLVFNAKSLVDEQGKPVGTSGTAYDITERKLAELESRQRSDEMASLLQTSKILTSTLDSGIVLQTTVDRITELSQLQSAAIYLLKGEALYLGATSPALPPQFPEEMRIASLTDHPHIHATITKGLPIFLPDTASVDLTPAERAVIEARGLRSILYLPLLVGANPKGVLIVASTDKPRMISDAEIDVCSTLANLASITIENAQLFETIQEHAANLEKKVFERTAELEAKNRELESFSYSVSHDLRAPLRAISGFSEIITRRFHSELNEQAMHYFDNIITASKRMGQLIDDLLSYSRLGRQAINRSKVNINEVLTQVSDELNGRITELNASVNVEPNLPVVTGNTTLIQQIFVNLLDNALAYHRSDVPPRINVTGSDENGLVTIRVTDNGLGIAPEFQDKVFNVFQRLHTEEFYPGTGIGLAIVKKAVELQGGRIGVESVVGQGTTFFIQFPGEN